MPDMVCSEKPQGVILPYHVSGQGFSVANSPHAWKLELCSTSMGSQPSQPGHRDYQSTAYVRTSNGRRPGNAVKAPTTDRVWAFGSIVACLSACFEYSATRKDPYSNRNLLEID